MGKRKKNKSNIPRHRRMNRSSRLQAAPHWIPKYEGKNLVHGYSKHFAVNKLNAVNELETLGYTFGEKYKQQLKETEIQKQREAEKRNAARKQKREQAEEDLFDLESDETFAYIAGYTSGGAPYGITWEELEKDNDLAFMKDSKNSSDSSKEKTNPTIDMDDETLPF